MGADETKPFATNCWFDLSGGLAGHLDAVWPSDAARSNSDADIQAADKNSDGTQFHMHTASAE
jgi:hypothetical protein